jgi:deazaflavin-dependent oxidoreductase (nitroreductase family)
MGVIVHAGRKTHRLYRTPVLVFRRGSDFIIALTYGKESQWVQNVVAQGGCELTNLGKTIHLTHPRILHDEQRRMMPAAIRPILNLLNVSDFLQASAAG